MTEVSKHFTYLSAKVLKDCVKYVQPVLNQPLLPPAPKGHAYVIHGWNENGIAYTVEKVRSPCSLTVVQGGKT